MAQPVPAATILLVRDAAAGLEVFLVERHHEIDFATGALVFPGGKLDPGDRDPRALARCARGPGPTDEAARALRVAAIRETFEEAGVLLARPRGSRALVDAARSREIGGRHRAGLLADAIALADVAETEDLELATDLLVPFAHWITPEFMPKRFDTHFFLVQAPPDQAAVHDGGESVDSTWATPAAALAEAEAGRRTIIFPTLLNLRKLGRSRSVAEALERARQGPIVTVLPRVERREGRAVVCIPAEADYGVTEATPTELDRRPRA
ncbi:MAG TPA: NUDIX hydrolase [Myxococcota bacterium]|nr:NUDIX hydrolase [Myxococcota bacterium]